MKANATYFYPVKKTGRKGYDLSFLKNYFYADEKSILKILRMYMQETPAELLKIEKALNEKTAKSAKKGIHRIRLNIQMLGVRETESFFDHMGKKKDSEPLTAADKKAFAAFHSKTLQTLEELEKDIFHKKEKKKK